MNFRRKILIWALAILAVGSMILPASLPAQAAQSTIQESDSKEESYDSTSSQVALSVTYGYGEAAKGGRYVPVRIQLENKEAAAFEGSIKIFSQESDYDVYRYDYPITIEASQTSETVINIPLGGRSDQLYVSIHNQAGTEVVRKRLKMNVSMDIAELFIGVLSDNPQQLQYLDGIGINHSMVRSRTFPLTTETMPVQDIGLDLLDVLLITNYDTENLSKEQLQAVLVWVEKGGTLLLGTGMRVDDVLGRFRGNLIDEPYGPPSVREVDMGVEYATNGPGDSFIQIPCTEISLTGGTEVLSSDQIPILTSVSRENGIIAVAAYDFVDIADFCMVQRSYVDKLFTSLLGEDKINALSDSLYNGNTNEYWSVQSMINTGDVDKLPNLPLYVIVVLTYIALVGPGMYLLLKHHERRRYYRTGIVVVSLVFTAVIYLMGSTTRFKSTFFTYATILDVSEDTVTDSTYINMRTPYNRSYTVELDPAYEIYPITRSYYYDMMPIPKFTGTEDYKVNISRNPESTEVSVQNVVAFTPKYFSLTKSTPNTENVGLQGKLTLFDGEISGTVTNNFDFPVENTAVLMYGQMIMLNELQPGETKKLDGMPVVNYPLSYTYLVAERISGGYQYKETDISDKDYMLALSRTNVLSFYLNNFVSAYNPNAKIVAFSKEKSESQFLEGEAYETYGMTMLTSTVDVTTEQDGQIFRSALRKRPTVVSGSYNAPANTAYGADPVVLEYSLGNDIQVEKLTFSQLSAEFLENDKYDSLRPFAGSLYFYNHNTGSYDQKDIKQTEYSGEELQYYLSPGNTITIKYVGEKVADYNWYVMLPLLTTVGRDK